MSEEQACTVLSILLQVFLKLVELFSIGQAKGQG